MGTGHEAEITVAVNVWATQLGLFPPQLAGRVAPALWQQFITEVSMLYMQYSNMPEGAREQMLVQVEQVYGPQVRFATVRARQQHLDCPVR